MTCPKCGRTMHGPFYERGAWSWDAGAQSPGKGECEYRCDCGYVHGVSCKDASAERAP